MTDKCDEAEARKFQREEAATAREFQRKEADTAREFQREEAEKALQLERDKTCFQQNSEHLRSLNHLMWQVPLIAMTVTGGLWYGIAQQGVVGDIRKPLLLFACLANLSLIFVMIRVRHIFEKILDLTKPFSSNAIADTKKFFLPEKSVLVIFCVLLGFSSVISFVGAVMPDKLFNKYKISENSGQQDALRTRAYQNASNR